MSALERRLRAAVAAFVVLLAADYALPYVGLRDDSCQTMFSALEWGERWNNHFFLPQHAVSDVWAYLELRDVVVAPPPGPARLRYVTEWLEQPDRARNTEAVRVAVDQLCAAGHHVALSVRRIDRCGPLRRVEDACRVPALASPHRWLPVRVYETDIPLPPRPHRCHEP